jgi:hypothetical protein
MRRTEWRLNGIRYCDWCGKEIHGTSYGVTLRRTGQQLDFHPDNATDSEHSCYDLFEAASNMKSYTFSPQEPIPTEGTTFKTLEEWPI